MKGRDLRTIRGELGATRQEIADLADLSPEILEQWELFDLKIPRKDAQQLKLAIWMLRQERVLAESGLPECESMKTLVEQELDPEAITNHLNDCDVCQTRKAYAEKHAPPMPGAMGVLGRVLSISNAFPGVLRSAFYGFLMVLVFTGVGVLYLLGMGLIRGDGEMIGGAFALLAVTASGGGAGGVVHYYTRPLRGRGALAYYLSWILVLYGYLVGALGLIWGGTRLIGPEGFDQEALEMAEMVGDPIGALLMAILWAVFGIVVGRAMRDTDDALEVGNEAVPEAEEPSRGLTLGRVGNAFLYLLLIGGVALQFIGGGGDIPGILDYEEELPTLREAAQADPTNAEAQYELAYALSALGRHEDALPPFRRAIQLDPENADLHNGLGWSLMQRGQLDDALSHFERAVQIDPGYAVAQQNMGWALYNLGRDEDALQAYQETLRLNSDNAGAHVGLGYVLSGLGQDEQAANAAREAVDLEPGNAAAHGLLARALFQLREYGEALPAAQEAVRLDPDNPIHQEALGLVLVGLGEGEKALPKYRRAVELAPEDPRLWRDLARLAHMLGRYEEAAQAYERLDQLDPVYFDHVVQDREMWMEARGKADSGR